MKFSNLPVNLVVLAITATVSIEQSAWAAPFTDGLFEAPGMTDVAAGGALNISGTTEGAWTATAGPNINLLDGDFFGGTVTGGVGAPPAGNDAFDGSQYIAFNGGGTGAGGALSQTFDTTAGLMYEVEFSIAGGDFDGSSHQIDAEVSGAGGVLGSLLDQVATNNAWTTHSFSFIADSASATLTFTDDLQAGGASSDLLLDGVSVTANTVPEPASIALWSVFGLALAGFCVYCKRRKK